MDPITAFFAGDWASLGGWSLLITFLVVWVGVGSFREWWVPGPRHRRVEELLTRSTELNRQQSQQIEKLVQGNELTKYYFEATMPVRPGGRQVFPREADDEGESGGDPA